MVDTDIGFLVKRRLAVVQIRVEPGGIGDGTIIEVVSAMVVNVPLTPELYKWVATIGQNFLLGGVVIKPTDDDKLCRIFFRYAITGVDVDESELANAVGVVGDVAEQFNAEIHEKFGGERLKHFQP